MPLNVQIAAGGHSVRLAIETASTGWNVREELDQMTVQLKHYDDWHRAERAMHMLELHFAGIGTPGLKDS